MHFFLRLSGFSFFTVNSVSSDNTQQGDSRVASLRPYPGVRQLLLSSSTETAHPKPHMNMGRHLRVLPQTFSKSQTPLPVFATECWVVAR